MTVVIVMLLLAFTIHQLFTLILTCINTYNFQSLKAPFPLIQIPELSNVKSHKNTLGISQVSSPTTLP